MCRNIRSLYNYDPPATEDEIQAAALQYVRKISGYTKPSQTNEAAFKAAVESIAAASSLLISSLQTTASPRNREFEITQARVRAAHRFPRKV